MFAAKGYFETRIVDIVAAAGISVGSFYNYFDTKEDIFREVAFEVIDELTSAPRRDPDNVERDPRRDIAHAVRRYVEVCGRHASLTADIRQMSHLDPRLRDHRARRVEENAARGARFIRRLQKSGRADSDLDPRLTAMALQSMIVSVVYDHLVLADEPPDVERLVETLTRIWLKAIGL